MDEIILFDLYYHDEVEKIEELAPADLNTAQCIVFGIVILIIFGFMLYKILK